MRRIQRPGAFEADQVMSAAADGPDSEGWTRPAQRRSLAQPLDRQERARMRKLSQPQAETCAETGRNITLLSGFPRVSLSPWRARRSQVAPCLAGTTN